MARFRFNLRRVTATPTPHPLVSQRALRALAQDDDDDAADEPVGPGWFESSQDLVSGLEVQESSPSDAWLNDWLAACARAAAPGSAAAAQGDEQPGAGLVPAASHGALGDAQQFGDLGLAVAPEVTHLDEFSEFGIEGLELV